MLEGDGHVMRQAAKGESKIDEHPCQSTPEVKVCVPPRDDLLCSLDSFEVPRLFSSPDGKSLHKALAEGMPSRAIEHVHSVNGGRPCINRNRKETFVAFSHEPQKFGPSGISDQRRDEREGGAGLPTAAVNAWKVALGHALTNPATKRRASNLPVD
jgi:hypothetical protein